MNDFTDGNKISVRQGASLQTVCYIHIKHLHQLPWNMAYLCNGSFKSINLLKPIGYMMHQQFTIQQLYALPTRYLCVLYLSENKQRLVPLTA